MTSASGVRIGWAELPHEVRSAVEAIIGGTVVEAVSHVGGFSPGTADRVRTAEGRRAFVKAVSPAQNEHSPTLHPADLLAEDFAGWHRISADPPADLHPWAARHLDELRALADRGLAALTGDTLVHTDIRADNILLSPEGTMTILNWPWACRGPAWLDTLLLLINARLYGGHDTHALLTKRATVTGADPHDLIAVLTSLAGHFTDAARQPPPKGLPTLRAFQRAHADAVLSWLHEIPVVAD